MHCLRVFSTSKALRPGDFATGTQQQFLARAQRAAHAALLLRVAGLAGGVAHGDGRLAWLGSTNKNKHI